MEMTVPKLALAKQDSNNVVQISEEDGLETLVEEIGKLLSAADYHGMLNINIRVRENDFEVDYEELVEEA
jgi:hypothetical protein